MVNLGRRIIGAAAAICCSCGVASAQTDADRALTSELLADAQTRTSFLSSDGQAGYGDNGFFIQSADGDFELNVGATLQFRYFYNVGDTSDDTVGFDFGETSLRIGGSLYDDRARFYIEGDFDNDGGGAVLDEAWAELPFGENFSLRMGQIYTPFYREDLINEEEALAVDRSLVNYAFGGGNVQGVQFAWETNNLRLLGSFNDGIGSANSDFTSSSEADFGLTGRVEWLAAGDWDQLSDWTSERGEDLAVLVGGAVHYQDGGETAGTADMSIFSYTADVSTEWNGWNFSALGVGRQTESPMGDFDDFGYVFQGGYRVIENGEVFGRFEGFIVDDARGLPNDNFEFVTVGYNHYLAGHAAKLTADVVIPTGDTDGINALGDFSDIGVLGANEDAVVRLQFQLMF